MMSQLAIDFTPRVRNSDPQTSKQAAKRVDKFAGPHFTVIMDALCYGAGTCYEVAERTKRLKPHLDHVQCARRLGELYRAGKIKKQGEMLTANGDVLIEAETRPSPSGSPCTLWRLTGL